MDKSINSTIKEVGAPIVRLKVRLEAIYFCSPGFFSLNGREINSGETLPSPLSIGKRPILDDFLQSAAHPSVQLAEIPNCFGSSPAQNTLPWHFHPGSEELSESIQYKFSDGQVISAREILYHPHSLEVPAELLPTMNRIKAEVNASVWITLIPGDDLPLWGSLRKAELTLISILVRTCDTKSPHGPIEIWITNSQNRDEDRSGFKLNKIAIIPKLLSEWQLTSDGNWDVNDSAGWATLTFREHPQSPDGQIFQCFELDLQSKTLYFHPYSRIVSTTYQALSQCFENRTYLDWLEENREASSSKIEFPFQGHSNIQTLIEKVNSKLKSHQFTGVKRTSFHTIDESAIENHLWIDTTGKIRFCRQMNRAEESILIWNLPPALVSWIKGLNNGLGATTEKENRSLAQSRRGIKRDRDLKILKHTGFFALILLETSTFILKRTTFTGKPVQDFSEFFRFLLERLGVLFNELEKKAGFINLSPPLPLDKQCSKNLIDLIQTFTQQLIQSSDSDQDIVFTRAGEIRLASGVKTLLRLFQTVLARIALESKAQCFLKPRFNAFATFLDEESLAAHHLSVHTLPVGALSQLLTGQNVQSYSLTSNWLSAASLLHSILQIQPYFKLYYNDLPMDEMNAVDFKPEFNLVEASTPNTATPTTPDGEKNIDWFELHPKFFFKGVEIDTQKLERLSKEGVLEFQGKIYLIQDKNLPSIKRLESFWAKIQSSKLQTLKRRTEDTFLRLPRHQTLELLALRASGVAVQGGEHWKKVCQFYDSLDRPRDPLIIPPSIKAELKAYQQTGVRWLLDLYELKLGGILADDMGLGKTIQTLCFLDILRLKKEMGHALIIVPTSLTYNWISESTKFTPEIPIQIFQSKSKEQVNQFLASHSQAALICTYGLFTEHQEFFEKEKWNILIFDEAQNLKNITAKRTTASRKISAKFKVCLTGTPLENHLGEFYSLVDLVVSGSLGELSQFREKFVTPDIIAPEDLKFLKLKSKPLVLRRTKKEILSELPPKIESTIKLPFEIKQEKIYRDIALSWNEKVKESILSDGESKSQLLMLTALLRLRQVCSDPGSIPNVKYSESPPKINVLIEAVQEITESGESAIVFTQFLHTFERIKKELRANQITSFSLHGGTSRPEREKILKEFQETPKGSVLLMTLKSGGVGLNLVKASYVFHLEPWWNPAVENQATDRAHRIGQQKPVQVYRYLMKESVEEKIEILKERKSAKFNALFSSTESDAELAQSNSTLTQADFDYLLS